MPLPQGWRRIHSSASRAKSGTREYVVHPSYRMVYELDGDTVWILFLIHTAREWPPVAD
jgi:plasmid stabilization system protein ParE